MRQKQKKRQKVASINIPFHFSVWLSIVVYQSGSIQWIEMICSALWLILTMTIFNINCTINIGRIYNASYSSNEMSVSTTYQNSCSECICQTFYSTVIPLYTTLNCFTNNKTCQLFTNFSSTSLLRVDLNSLFIFTHLPPLQNTTTGN